MVEICQCKNIKDALNMKKQDELDIQLFCSIDNKDYQIIEHTTDSNNCESKSYFWF